MNWIFIGRTEDDGTLYQHSTDHDVYLVVYKHRTTYTWYVYEDVPNGFSSPLMTTNRLKTINAVFKSADNIACSWRTRF